MRLRSDPEGSQTEGLTAFLWVAGRPALDLCNTRLGACELLRSTSDLARWMSEAGLARGAEVSAPDLDAARRLREGLRRALLGGATASLAGLADAWLRDAPGRLRVDPLTLRTRFDPGAEATGPALVAVVLDALELARDRPGRVRECASPPCPVVYLDESRNRSRRWCAMERCGARAKAATYHRRHAGAGA